MAEPLGHWWLSSDRTPAIYGGLWSLSWERHIFRTARSLSPRVPSYGTQSLRVARKEEAETGDGQLEKQTPFTVSDLPASTFGLEKQ